MDQIIDFQEPEIETINYNSLLKQIESVVSDEKNLIANLANISAILMSEMKEHWVGFYLKDSDHELVLGPFQGPLACTRIAFDKGVCGKSWSSGKTIRVADVHAFDGHIACSAASNSEIVIPIIKNNSFVALLDIDSTGFDRFHDSDQEGLEKISSFISSLF